MSDIVDRLRELKTASVYGAPTVNEIATEATDEIARLRAKLATAREALEPFAHYAAEHEHAVSTLFTDDDSLWRCPGVADLTLGDCRQARRALAELDGTGGEDE